MPVYAKLRGDLISTSTVIDGVTIYNIKDPKSGNYFRLREPEFWLINQLDGKTSYVIIAENFRIKFNLDIDADNVLQFVNALEKLFFLENVRSEQAVSRKSYGREKKKTTFSKLLFIKINAFDPSRFLDKLTKIYRPFHKWYWVLVQMLIIFTGVALLSANFSYFSVTLTEIFNIGSIVTIVLAFFILVTFHELAHAVICRYYGGEVKSMGFLLLYFQPCFYTDLSDVIGVFINELARLTTIVCWITLLFNFNPLIKLDGYYLLSDWVDIPNLRKKAFAYFGNVFKRKILGWPEKAYPVTYREKKIFLVYAFFAIVYSVFLIGYMLWLIAGFLYAKMGGAGLFLLGVILLFTLRDNIASFFKAIVKHIIYMKQLFKKPIRLTVYIIILLAFLVVLFLVPFPHRVAGEITVRPIENFNLSMNELGYMESRYHRGGANPENQVSILQMNTNNMGLLELLPFVKDGQKISKGDTLAILSSSQVTKEIVTEASEMDRLKGELALLKAMPKKEEIAEAEADVRAARANFDKFKQDLNRARDLLDKKLISVTEFETTQADYDVARAELANKESRLDLLKAPPRPEEEAVLEAEIDKQKAKLDFLKHLSNTSRM